MRIIQQTSQSYIASSYNRSSESLKNQSNINSPTRLTTTPAHITGSAAGLLSSNTTNQIIMTAQQTGNTSTSTLPVSMQHLLDGIASDPTVAAKQAQMLANYPDAVEVSASSVRNQTGLTGAQQAAAFMSTVNASEPAYQQAQSVQQQRLAIYNSDTAKDVPAAQIYANMLQFNASLPQNYGNALLTDRPSGTWTAMQKDQATYLQQAINQANGSSSSSQTAPSTSSAVPASATATG